MQSSQTGSLEDVGADAVRPLRGGGGERKRWLPTGSEGASQRLLWKIDGTLPPIIEDSVSSSRLLEQH